MAVHCETETEAIWRTCMCFSNHEILYSIALNHFISTPSLFSSVCVSLSFFLSPHFPALLIIASVCARLYLILILLILLLVLALHELCCFPKTHQIGVRIWFPTQKQTIFYPEPLLMLMTCWGGLTATLVPALIYADINDNGEVRKWNSAFFCNNPVQNIGLEDPLSNTISLLFHNCQILTLLSLLSSGFFWLQ